MAGWKGREQKTRKEIGEEVIEFGSEGGEFGRKHLAKGRIGVGKVGSHVDYGLRG